MVKVCAIKSCKGRESRKLPLFELPEKSIHRQKWIDFLKHHQIDYDETKKYCLCLLHFCNSMINRNEKRVRLNFNAFPTLVSIDMYF